MLYDSPPMGFKPKFHATGVYVECDGHVLWLHRHPRKPEGGQWCLAGGKVEPGELPEECAARETLEETGVTLEFLIHTGTFYVRYDPYDFIYDTFRAPVPKRPTIDLKPDEHTEYRWLTPKEALALDLIEDEDAVLERVYGVR